jgi:hypothetical protein
MGQSKKQTPTRPPGRREFVRKMMQVQTEGQGVFQLDLIRQCDVPGLFLASATGDVGAMRTADLIAQFLKMIATVRPAALCLLCDTELSPAALPWAIVVMTAQRDDPTMAITNGLCVECAGKPEIEVAVLAKYRELIPDLRQLPPLGEPARA